MDFFYLYNRAMEGPRVDENDWDLKIMTTKSAAFAKEHGVKLSRETIICDSDMADRIFEAGRAMLVDLGFHLVDNHRTIKCTEGEILEGLRHSPRELTFGTGRESTHLRPRKICSDEAPVIQGGPGGALLSEQWFTQIIASYASQGVVDTLVNGALDKYQEQPIFPGSVCEIKAAKAEQFYMRQAAWKAGRAGMALCGPMSVRGMARSEADFCTSEAAVGLMQTDSHLYSQQNDLKINIDFLRQAQHVMDLGAVAATEYLPVFGCFLLSPEAAAVADVAATLASFGMFGASWHLDGPVHVRWNNTTARETLQTAGCCAAALDRNTDLILGNQCITMAGPCTEMVLIEIAAQAVTDTVSGREVASGVRCGRGVAVDKVTGMEARLLGEACEASCRLNLPKANEVINCLLAKYEPDYKAAIQPGSPHSGKLFADCYDPIAVVPKQAYIDVYNSAKKTMMSCGLLIK